MSKVKISPCKLSGTVKVPRSKSISHRAIICASLSKGISRIENISFSDDINATIDMMTALGAKISVYSDFLIVNGEDTLSQHGAEINCNMSGSTLRFGIPIALAGATDAKFTGKKSLFTRPLNVYTEIMEKQGITYSLTQDSISVNGKLSSGTFYVKGDVSSQFISGLMFSLPLLDGDSKIVLTTPLQSKGYIDLTIKTMADFGVQVDNHDYTEFVVKGNQSYKPQNYVVEGDFSQAAFFLCADALGADIWVQGLSEKSLQGDKIVLDILQSMGCDVIKGDMGIKVVKKNNLLPCTIDAKDCPDIVPALAVVSGVASGKTNFINCERLKIKESDRLAAVTENLENIGVHTEKTDNSFSVYGTDIFKGGEVKTYDDHRIAMAFGVAIVNCNDDLILDNKECVAKSYPDFWQDFVRLGGIVNEC